jgi:hypothetical protein
MFYATWIEHWLNDMILCACDRRNLSKENAKQVIRESSLRAKTGSVWNLLFAEDFPEDIRKEFYPWRRSPTHLSITSGNRDPRMHKMKAISGLHDSVLRHQT